MRTKAVDRADFALDIEQGDDPAAMLDFFGTARREFVQSRQFHELRHDDPTFGLTELPTRATRDCSLSIYHNNPGSRYVEIRYWKGYAQTISMICILKV